MPNSTEVAGISIGITADTTGLKDSLQKATGQINTFYKNARTRESIKIQAELGSSWNAIQGKI